MGKSDKEKILRKGSLLALAGAFLLSGQCLAEDPRQLAPLPAPAAEVLRQEMLDDLAALNEILTSLATSAYMRTIRVCVSLGAPFRDTAPIGAFRNANGRAVPDRGDWQTPRRSRDMQLIEHEGANDGSFHFWSKSTVPWSVSRAACSGAAAN